MYIYIYGNIYTYIGIYIHIYVYRIALNPSFISVSPWVNLRTPTSFHGLSFLFLCILPIIQLTPRVNPFCFSATG